MTNSDDDELQLDSAWWPDFIPPITDAHLISGDLITVAEIVEPWEPESYRQVYTGLIPLDLVDLVLSLIWLHSN